MKKITPFMFIFFVGFVISIASLTSYKKDSSIFCEISKNVELSVKDIINSKLLDIYHPQRKVFNRVAGYNRKTFKRKIKYYIHDENGYLNLNILPSLDNLTYEISDDEEQFIVDTFQKIDSYIDLDFERVYSIRRAHISIFKSKPDSDNALGLTRTIYWERPSKYKVGIAWREYEVRKKKLKKYPTLSYTDAETLAHEIAHAVGLSHRVGKDYANNIDPLDVRFDDRDTIMSYRDSACNPPEEDYFLTELDIKALRTLWGVEKNN